ncbi:MAG: sugar ABC transporter permease [Actinomycetaceae bacterium]|nr:sugar ABC transporter permease [Actinomycetaceae bacterium]
MQPNRWYTPYLLAGPAVLWVLVFSLWPFLNTVVLSFTNARPLQPATLVWFDNYQKLFDDEMFRYAIVNSFIYALACVPLLTFLPLFLAMLVQRVIPGIGFFRTTAYFPVVASVVVVSIIWGWLFESRGVINGALKALGIQPVDFLIYREWILFTAVTLTVWKGIGYYMVIYLAALGSVNKELYEAAALDGAGWWRRFWTVTVPGVKGAILLISALITVAAIRVFSELYVLTGGNGGPGGHATSIVMYVKQVGSGLSGRLGYASAVSVALFFLTIGPLLLVGYINQKDEIRDALRVRKLTRAQRRKMKAGAQ